MKQNKKQQIIDTTINLFTEQGVGQVRVRDIAKRMGLSPGNITYHFKTWDILFSEIYNQMVSEMEKHYQPTKDLDLRSIHALFWQAYRFQWKYRFFFTDLVTISQRFPEIFAKHETIRKKRAQQSLVLIDVLIKKELLKKEESPFQYGLLLHAIWNMFPSTISQVAQLKQNPNRNDLPVRLAWNLFLPHLTKLGLTQYNQIMEK